MKENPAASCSTELPGYGFPEVMFPLFSHQVSEEPLQLWGSRSSRLGRRANHVELTGSQNTRAVGRRDLPDFKGRTWRLSNVSQVQSCCLPPKTKCLNLK